MMSLGIFIPRDICHAVNSNGATVLRASAVMTGEPARAADTQPIHRSSRQSKILDVGPPTPWCVFMAAPSMWSFSAAPTRNQAFAEVFGSTHDGLDRQCKVAFQW